MNIPSHITRPARYTGIEPNRIVKGPAGEKRVRFALCYPDIYEVGMSYYGLFLLYELMNSRDDTWCERCFAPWHDMEEYLRKNGLPLVTLESHTPLGLMDAVGFSLSYELNVTNVLNMLALARIPLRNVERRDGPVVIGGGPMMLNPKPIERFFDIIVTGEADEVLLEMLDILKASKGGSRADAIREMGSLEGVYSPLFPKETVKRLFVKDLDRSFHPERPPIPVVGSIHNRLNIEVSRGCGNGCRFCLAGFGYRPYRERSFGKVAEIIDRALKATGYEEISLLSLSTGDYGGLFRTISHIRERHRGVSVALPSLKIGSIGEEEISAIGDIARTGLTFALESASPQIRGRLNKNIDVDALVKVLPVLRKYGWRKLKLYCMIGFPWEKEEDILMVRELVEPFAREGMSLNLAVSPFIPKPHTPFQWLPMESEDVLAEKMLMVKRALKKKNVTVKYRDIKTSIVEGIISRGDDRLGGLFEYLAGRGAKLEAWREFFRPQLYEEWFLKEGEEMGRYLGAKSPDAKLPWSFIDMGVGEGFLGNEYGRAEAGERTVSCYSGCAQCGVSCPELWPAGNRQSEAPAFSVSGGGAPDRGRLLANIGYISYRFTFRYGKWGDARYIGHLDTMGILLRALRAAGVSIKMYRKYHPMPKISLSEALPMGIESTCELIEVETEGGVFPGRDVVAAMNAILPGGMRVLECGHGKMQGLARECAFLLVADRPVDVGEFWLRSKGGKYLYISKERKGIKDLWKSGIFSRIIKMEARRIHGIGTDNQCDFQ